MNSEKPDEKVIVLFNGQEMQLENINVKIFSKINEHITAHIIAMVKIGNYDEHVKKANHATKITIKHTIKGQNSLLYEGVIVFIKAKAEGSGKANAVYFIEIKAFSHTCLMDIKLIKKSFQDKKMKYEKLVEKVIEKYNGADCIVNSPKGVELEYFVLQYLDTDWGFLRREISKFEEGLFADAMLPAPKFQMGTPIGKERGSLDEFNYIVSKNLRSFSENNKNIFEHQISEFDFMEYEIFDAYAKETFLLGDKVKYKEISLYVCDVFSEIKDNKLYNTYKLKTKDGLKISRLSNNQIQGLSIPGKVIAVEKNVLKLHLEIDKEQPIETAYWFDYAAFYATWYCMPEVNDFVNLHIPTPNEFTAIGINSFKQNPSGGYTRNNQVKTPNNTSALAKKGAIDFEKSACDPDVKLLTTKAGRMIQLGPDNIKIQYDPQTIITLDDVNGISMTTDQDISMFAKGSIYAFAQESIYFVAQQNITMKNNQSSIVIDPRSITIKSEDTKMN